MAKVFERPKALTDKPFHYCPGCAHGIVYRLVAEVIDELGVQDKTIGVAQLDVQYLHMTILIVICMRHPMAGHQQWLQG